MPYRIAQTFTIESGHILSKHPGKCRFPHGHSRTIQVVFAADRLDARDMVCDFKTVEHLLRHFCSAWDHAICLNTDDPNFHFFEQHYGERVIAFPHADPTSEVMARVIFDEVKRALAATNPGAEYPITPHVRLERVRVTETGANWAEFAE